MTARIEVETPKQQFGRLRRRAHELASQRLRLKYRGEFSLMYAEAKEELMAELSDDTAGRMYCHTCDTQVVPVYAAKQLRCPTDRTIVGVVTVPPRMVAPSNVTGRTDF